jgi:TonB family protein
MLTPEKSPEPSAGETLPSIVVERARSPGGLRWTPLGLALGVSAAVHGAIAISLLCIYVAVPGDEPPLSLLLKGRVARVSDVSFSSASGAAAASTQALAALPEKLDAKPLPRLTRITWAISQIARAGDAASSPRMPESQDLFSSSSRPARQRESPRDTSLAAAAPSRASAKTAPARFSPPALVGMNGEEDKSEPRIIHNPLSYPPQAFQLGLRGKAWLDVRVTHEGRVANVQMVTSSGHKILDEAAMHEVWTWRFRPAERDGVPIAMTVKVYALYR